MNHSSHIDSPHAGLVETAAQSQHLSDEQFATLLFGTRPAAVQAHLNACMVCSEEAERVGVAVGDFEQNTRLWSERRAATWSPIYPVRRTIPAWVQVPAAWAVAAVALVIATTVGLPHVGQREASGKQTSSAAMTGASSMVSEVPAPSLKNDDELLSAIDGKLRANDTPPAQFYGLQVDDSMEQDKSSHEVSD